MADPCQTERDKYEHAIEKAIAAAAAAAVAAPETLGASILVGLLVGAASGLDISDAENDLDKCLRDHGLTAQADALQQGSEQLRQEVAALAAATSTPVA